ncbi:hypothetical protein DSECCO2_351080 [anaerobic digester metagenome]
MKRMLILTGALVLALVAAGCTGSGPGASGPAGDMPSITDESVNETLRVYVTEAQRSLDALDANTSSAATALARTGLSGPGAEDILLDLSRSGNYTNDAVTFDTSGEIVAVMPEDYQFAVGANIHGSSNIQAALNGSPGMSTRINLVEGFRGIALAHPVMNATSAAGGVSVIFRPERMLASSALKALGNGSHTLSAVQTDGTIIFDTDLRLIGQSMLNATQYGTATDLAELARNIVSTPSGIRQYRVNETTTRTIAWQTVGLHGTDWRLVVNQGR